MLSPREFSIIELNGRKKFAQLGYAVYMRLRLSIDKDIVALARRKAKALGKSLNQMIPDYLLSFVDASTEHSGVQVPIRARELARTAFYS